MDEGVMPDRAIPDKDSAQPDSTAVRVALWRARHIEVDPPPHVIEDEIGLALAAPASPNRRPVASISTSCSAQASTPLSSDGRRSPRASPCSRSTGPRRRRGSGSA
jgi:hypothetical protein